MAKGKNIGESKKSQHKMYPNRYMANRKRRLERHLKDHPEDAVAQAALKDIHYRRRAPNSRRKMWTPGKIEYAQQLALTGENGNKALLLGVKKEDKLRDVK